MPDHKASATHTEGPFWIPTVEEAPTIDLLTAAAPWKIGRTAAYAGANAGTLPFPVIRVAGKFRAPTAPWRKSLGLDEAS
jgi:hypothetical protein